MPEVKDIDELGAAELAALDVAKIDKLEAAVDDVPTLSATIREVFGALPALRIDISDPPSLPMAHACGVTAIAATADGAIRELATGIAAELDVAVGEDAVDVKGP